MRNTRSETSWADVTLTHEYRGCYLTTYRNRPQPSCTASPVEDSRALGFFGRASQRRQSTCPHAERCPRIAWHAYAGQHPAPKISKAPPRTKRCGACGACHTHGTWFKVLVKSLTCRRDYHTLDQRCHMSWDAKHTVRNLLGRRDTYTRV